MRRLKIGILAAAIAMAAWVAIDLLDSSRHDLRSFDGHEVARLETEMWRSYYDHRSIRLFRELVVLLREQYHLNFWRSCFGAYHAARAAVVFQPGHDRTGYLRALPDVHRYYRLIERSSTTSFDVDRVSKAELEWWIVHRERALHRPGELAQSLCELQAAIYGGQAEQYREHGEARADAMLLRDERAAAGGVSEQDWRKIGELLDKSWTALGREVSGPAIGPVSR